MFTKSHYLDRLQPDGSTKRMIYESKLEGRNDVLYLKRIFIFRDEPVMRTVAYPAGVNRRKYDDYPINSETTRAAVVFSSSKCYLNKRDKK